jgi:hypothetical protein
VALGNHSFRRALDAHLTTSAGLRAVLIAMMVLAALANGLSAGIWTRHFHIDGPYQPDTGLAWYVPPGKIAPPLGWLTIIATDSLAEPAGSDVAVSDGAGPLGPAHSAHAEIRASGQGRYSYWNDSLLFSTRHGEDPNLTGTELVVAAKVTLAAPIRIVLTVLGGLAALGLGIGFRGVICRFLRAAAARLWGVGDRLHATRLRYRLPPTALVAIALFALGFDAAALCRSGHVIFYGPDSDGYYLFASIRTAGYGLVLRGCEALFGDPYAVVPLQFAVSILANLVLCTAVRRVFRSSLLALFLGIVLTMKLGLIELHFVIMPDSLFFSCATAELGLALLLLDRASTRRLGAAGAVLAVAMLLRPAAIGLLPGLAVVAALVWRQRPRAAGLLVALLLASLFANALVQPLAAAITGQPDAGSDKFSGFVLIGSGGFLLTPDTPTSQPELRDRLVTVLAPLRAAWSAARTIAAERDIIVPGQDEIIYRIATPAVCAAPIAACLRPETDAAFRSLALDAIRHDPQGMLAEFVAKLDEDAAETLSGAWLSTPRHSLVTARDSLEQSPVGRAWQSAYHYDLALRDGTLAPDPFDLGTRLYQGRALVNAVILIGTLAAIMAGLAAAIRRRLGTELAGLGVAAAGFLGYHVFVCLIEVPLVRYAEPLTAWFLLSLGGGVLLVLRHVRHGRAGDPAPPGGVRP